VSEIGGMLLLSGGEDEREDSEGDGQSEQQDHAHRLPGSTCHVGEGEQRGSAPALTGEEGGEAQQQGIEAHEEEETADDQEEGREESERASDEGLTMGIERRTDVIEVERDAIGGQRDHARSNVEIKALPEGNAGRAGGFAAQSEYIHTDSAIE